MGAFSGKNWDCVDWGGAHPLTHTHVSFVHLLLTVHTTHVNARVHHPNKQVGYDYLVVAAGLQINWDKIKGLPETIGGWVGGWGVSCVRGRGVDRCTSGLDRSIAWTCTRECVLTLTPPPHRTAPHRREERRGVGV